jgi:hypothetical protein
MTVTTPFQLIIALFSDCFAWLASLGSSILADYG